VTFRTHKEARMYLLASLEELGWIVVRERYGKPLKKPHATKGDVQIEFTPQSVHMKDCGHSLYLDLKNTSAEKIVNAAELHHEFERTRR